MCADIPMCGTRHALYTRRLQTGFPGAFRPLPRGGHPTPHVEGEWRSHSGGHRYSGAELQIIIRGSPEGVDILQHCCLFHHRHWKCCYTMPSRGKGEGGRHSGPYPILGTRGAMISCGALELSSRRHTLCQFEWRGLGSPGGGIVPDSTVPDEIRAAVRGILASLRSLLRLAEVRCWTSIDLRTCPGPYPRWGDSRLPRMIGSVARGKL